MTRYPGFTIGFLLSALGGLALRALRPAPLLHAVVGEVTAAPMVARVALAYGIGLAPLSAVVRVSSANAELGSATISGTRLFVDVPLCAVPRGEAQVSVTLRYRVAGVLVERVHETRRQEDRKQ